jgi:hypothetical protein
MYNPSGQGSGVPSNNPNSNTGTTGLPPLILNARLHELVIAGTGQNERLEPACEHVNH